INYEYAHTSNVTIDTGFANDDFDVLATGAQFGTYLVSAGITGGVTVGSAGSVQGITKPLILQPLSGLTGLTVDDSADTTPRTVTLDTTTLIADPVPYGIITGLAPADIEYRYAGTASVTVKTGSAANAVNVRAA